MFDTQNHPHNPTHCKLECTTEDSICGYFGNCPHHKQLDSIVSRRVLTINKRCSIYGLEPVTKDTIETLILSSISSGFRCSYCNEELKLYSSKSDFRLAVSIDHIKAMANGGGNEQSNLIICCTRCNLVKGTMKEKHFKLFIKVLLETGGREELLEWLEDAYQHALAYKIERLKIEGVH